MPAIAEERVLVVPTEKLRDLGYFQGFTADVERYLPALFEGDDLAYRPRREMENDPSYKQLIPYVVFRHVADDGGIEVFQYERGSGQGEQRLHRLRSVGVGGHISSEDQVAGDQDDPYRTGMHRELAEEVSINTGYEERCIGLLNDDETEVGKVHLGVVHLCDVEARNILPREEDLLDARFVPVSQLFAAIEQYETWSQIVIRAIFQDHPEADASS